VTPTTIVKPTLATATVKPPSTPPFVKPLSERPPQTGLALWWLIPTAVRRQLRARVPLDARVIDDTEALVVGVGSGCPVRWLLLSATDDGRIRCRLWQVLRTGAKDVAEATVAADCIVPLLQKWAADYGLSG
jgi:hypothetical protein